MPVVRLPSALGGLVPRWGRGLHPSDVEPATHPPWAAPTLWQFTDKYPIPGFGTVDASIFLGDEDAFAAFLTK